MDHTDAGDPVYQLRWLVGDLLDPRAERCAWPVELKLGRLYVLRAGLTKPVGHVSPVAQVETGPARGRHAQRPTPPSPGANTQR